MLSAGGFTSAFATARGITHLIRSGKGPFGNLSAGGQHLHHSTFGARSVSWPAWSSELAAISSGGLP